MEIIMADPTGICFGVERALKKAEEAVDDNNREHAGSIYSFGSLIHNKQVTDSLEQKGLKIIDSLDEAEEGSTVILRCHGVPEEVYSHAEDRGLRLVDTTCPFVEKIHRLVEKASKEGKNILIIGDEKHPEVKGINGWCGNGAEIIDDPEDAAGLEKASYFVVAQTTFRSELFDEIIEAISEKGIETEVNNTICHATGERQTSCRRLAGKVDAMVIIGDRNSSNSKKLFDIAGKNCRKSFFVENKQDLPLKELSLCNRIGVAAGASTPACIIKEVISNMSDNITNNNEELSMADFMEDIEKSLRLPRGGDIVEGKIHQVTDDEIIVNLGCKKDGIIPLAEISLEGDQKLTDLYNEGDPIQAKVIKTDDGEGSILLSKKKLEVSEHWNEISSAFEDKETIEATVVRVVNGGVIATYKEVSGFIPLSQLSDRYVEDPSEFVGQTLEVKVSRVDQRRGKAVFSHKMVLNAEKEKRIEEIWERIHVDDVVRGTVMRFTDYGAFVNIGGIDGLLHISEISWGKLKHPKEVLSIGQEIDVKVLAMNREKGKISLGLKQNQPEPWSVINDNYEVGQIVEGKIVQIKEYGAFVELEPGLDGLVHISEVAHKRVSDINNELSVGQMVNAKILDIDADRKRISLSIKEAKDPEEEAAEEAAKKAAEEEAKTAEEAAPAEEAPAEEAPAEEAPAEEAPAEEAPAEETPAEEASAEE
ncbi:MAG: bifunctional 4-hydroxy-3-methylbut-2-enyl diphosphate reductase/30S ribosomal protein S1 [Firmicutes bacterium]|nr:bifunctional 4-hydroxy-3-methylbut-2-enyl diphosphate reductase/30S ribosomal protein S1 [Bacillota bacterium]